MKHLSRAITAIFMAILMGTLLPAKVFADTPTYISEVKIGMGVSEKTALKGIEGYTVLKDDDGDPIDLNETGGLTSHNSIAPRGAGEKIVLLGYKTTKNRKEAITDLALMNMKGGYDVNDYEILMDKQMKAQILPFVENFSYALNEYRANIVSKNKKNKQRAAFIREVLNKLVDDDTGKPLGDLLLKKTKYEMGDEAYNALSAEEKKEHADIVTIIAQANGWATLMLENLITRAADTGNNTWLDRFSKITYDDLIEQTGLSDTDAAKKVAKLYDDNANQLLDMWEDFRTELFGYDAAVKTVEDFDAQEVEAAIEAFKNIDDKTSTKQKEEIIKNYENAIKQLTDYSNANQIVLICETLSEISYLDGTMLDFFKQESSVFEDDITLLYPMAASFTKGQLTGLEFVSLKELIMVAVSKEEGYSDDSLSELESASIYEGVDRGIYEKGGVALTTAARRKNAEAYRKPEPENSKLYNIMKYITLGLLAASAVSGVVTLKLYMFAMNSEQVYANKAYEIFNKAVSTAWRNSKIALGMTVGLTMACAIMSLITIAINAYEMGKYYNVEFTPIPRYMVDEKDLIAYNKKGEKYIMKNQTAYYKAVECNRNENDNKYKYIGTYADMNGDVGAQWLALYAVKNELMNPILASSLKVVLGSEQIPAGYDTGMHMFGSDAAFNLNNLNFVFNNEAKSIYVYFKTDEEAPSAAGTNFSAGTLAVTGGAGLILGAAIASCIGFSKKRKDNKAVTV